jgi:hypothetical protein
MSSYLSSRLEADPGTEIDCHTDVVALHGDSHLEGVTFREARTGKMRETAAPRPVHHGGRRTQYRLALGSGGAGREGLLAHRADRGRGFPVRNFEAGYLRGWRYPHQIGQARGVGHGRRVGRGLESVGIP